MKISVFLDVSPCSLINVYKRFGGTRSCIFRAEGKAKNGKVENDVGKMMPALGTRAYQVEWLRGGMKSETHE
jgi:hypothetical protein